MYGVRVGFCKSMEDVREKVKRNRCWRLQGGEVVLAGSYVRSVLGEVEEKRGRFVLGEEEKGQATEVYREMQYETGAQKTKVYRFALLPLS